MYQSSMKLRRNIAISESGFLFDPTAGESFSLNEQGLEIINMMRQNLTVEEITNSMRVTYEVEQDEFEKYLFDFMGMLKQFKLVEDDGQN